MNNTLLSKLVQWLRRLFGTAERVAAPPVRGEAVLSSTHPTFHLLIKGADQAIPVTLMAGQQLVLGRTQPDDFPKPSLDLSLYNAIEHGVSRQHASILRDGQTLTLVDLGSTNGTYLNGQPLDPHEPRPLRDGDDIRLGRLRVSYYEVHIPQPPRWIRLYTQSGNATRWWATEREWNYFLDLATIHGWKPALGDLRAYQGDTAVSTEDAQALANALENAIQDRVVGMEDAQALVDALESAQPDLADEMERGFPGPRPLHEHWQAGNLSVRDLIAFCRLGGFRIVLRTVDMETPGE